MIARDKTLSCANFLAKQVVYPSLYPLQIFPLPSLSAWWSFSWYWTLFSTHIPLNVRAHFSAQIIQAVLLSWCGNHMKDKEATLYDMILRDIYHYGRSVRENGTKLSQERDLSQVVSRSTLFSLNVLPPYKVAGSRSSLTRREQAMRKPKFQP